MNTIFRERIETNLLLAALQRTGNAGITPRSQQFEYKLRAISLRIDDLLASAGPVFSFRANLFECPLSARGEIDNGEFVFSRFCGQKPRLVQSRKPVIRHWRALSIVATRTERILRKRLP